MNALVIFVLSLTYLVAEGTMPLPPYISKCPRQPSPALKECVLKQAPKVLVEMAKGDPKYNLPSLDPFLKDFLPLKSPAITINLTDAKILGISASTVTEFEVDDVKKQFTIGFVVPKVTVIAQSSIETNLRIIKFRGVGGLQVVIDDLKGLWVTEFSLLKHDNGLEYFDLAEGTMQFEVGKIQFHLDSLNGDKALGATITTAFNTNWQLLAQELQGPIGQTINTIQKVLLRAITKNVAYRDFFQFD